MFGNNPIRSPMKGDGKNLDIQNIFSTFQGEGPFAGYPSIFIRLGGCNLACSFCDTEFESFTNISLEDIIQKVKSLSLNKDGKRVRNLVVITGGEPFRQPIELLCEKLLNENFEIQIETNGTLFREIDKRVAIICSPKNTGNGYHKIREDLLSRINAFKFIISASIKEYNNIGEVGQSDYNIPVYIQPMDQYNDELNKQNLDYVVKLSLEHGYRISLQLHKIANVE